MNFVASKTPFYAVLYPLIRAVAAEHGYALALHGSLQKDLDVIAVPWVEGAAAPDILATAIAERAGGFIAPGCKKLGDKWKPADEPERKPHGRLCYTIHLGGAGGYIDLSVMPLTPV